MGVTRFPNGVNIGNADGGTAEFQLGGTAVTATAAELNLLDGGLGAAVLTFDSATPYVVASGSTAITGGGTIATGLGGTVQYVTASLTNNGTAAFVVHAAPVAAAGGSVIFYVYGQTGAAAASAGTVNWIAFGTGA